MCGIFGIIAQPESIGLHQLEKSVKKLFLLSETRGKESSGIAITLPDSILYQKSAVRPRDFIKSHYFRKYFKNALQNVYESSESFAIIGHSRLVTNGNQNIHRNNQPVDSGGLLAVHNGIIVNESDLWNSSDSLKRETDLDTEVMLQILSTKLSQSLDLPNAIRDTFKQITGTVSTAIAFEKLNCILIATNYGSLYTLQDVAAKVFVFASERSTLETLIRTGTLGLTGKANKIERVEADHGWIADLDNFLIHPIDLRTKDSKQISISQKTRAIRDETPDSVRRVQVVSALTQKINTADLSKFEIDTRPIQQLKRCKKCILPETVPFIKFDNLGVCNFCNNHLPKKYHGREALEKSAEKLKFQHRGKDADCLFTLSGGRDSSYGLHYAVKELGLRPVAYTYDWGMITDLARRNQARMCGELKVEHIIVSADIIKKRDYIRRNVSAWLKKPELGIIPLFMAGDKQYFYHANKLGESLGLNTTVLASNPLEKTQFKSGFCGIEPTQGHRPSSFSQMQMAAYYGLNFLSNRSYFNRSLLDTMAAFASYYFLRHEYLRLFDYVPWDEIKVNDTLLQEYDWETATDTKSTWRIGDGTAAFYNYIYYKVAGFTENDTFRSNQIRENMMDRDHALRLSETENMPRFDSIDWYCKAIGLNITDVLAAVSEIPTLYHRS